MGKHKVILRVEFEMDEMDGTPEQSAEIAMDLLDESCFRHWFRPSDIEVIDFSRITDGSPTLYGSAEEARDAAIQWQHSFGDTSMSWVEVADWETHFRQVADEFPELRDEFIENGIIGR